MATISASLVKELRDKTNAGMMECKRALEEAHGDLEQAEVILRKRGVDVAAKRAGRSASEGVIATHVSPDAKVGSLIELNCETDFVARNEEFTSTANDLAEWVAGQEVLLADGERNIDEEALKTAYGDTTLGEFFTALIAKTGENVVFPRICRYAARDGRVASYIHIGSKVGVLLEVSAPEEVCANAAFPELMKEVTLQIAAASPEFLSRDEVPAQRLEAEKEVYRAQMANKPANVLDKIIEGKLRKFYSEICLLDQPFVKDQDITVGKLVEQRAKEFGGPILVKRFVRYQVGERAGG